MHLGHEVHDNHHHDQQRGPAKVERHVGCNHEKLRQQTDSRHVQGAEQGEPSQHAIDVARRLLARTNPRDKRTGLLEVLRYVLRVEHQRRVEIAEENDTGTEQQDVERLTGRNRLRQISEPAHILGLPEPLPQGRRKEQNAAGEDRRNYTGHVHLQRQMAGLRCEDLTPLLTLGVMHRDATLPPLDEDDEADDRNRQQAHSEQRDDIDITLPRRLEGLPKRTRNTGNDPREDQHRDAITDAALGDLLTQPHHEHGARDEGRHGHEVEAKVATECDALPRQANGHTDSLDDGERQRPVTSVLADLATTGLALFLQLLQLRADGSHQLHDDRCRNVRHDPQREDAHPLQRTAGEHVEQTKNGPLVLAEQLGEPIRIDPRNRNMRPNPVDNNRQEQEAQTSPEFRQPAICQRGESTLLSHLVLELTASCFNRRTRTLGGCDALQGQRTPNLTGQHDFHTLHVLVDDVGILKALESNDVTLDLGQLGGTHLSAIHSLERDKAELRQTTMQRLLTTLEARGNRATGARGLTLVATATGFAEPAADTTARTQLFATGTRRGTQIVQLHD